MVGVGGAGSGAGPGAVLCPWASRRLYLTHDAREEHRTKHEHEHDMSTTVELQDNTHSL